MNKFKFTGKTNLKLNRGQTRVYEDSGEVGDRFRRETKEAAKERAKKVGKPVEISSFDGVTFEQIYDDY